MLVDEFLKVVAITLETKRKREEAYKRFKHNPWKNMTIAAPIVGASGATAGYVMEHQRANRPITLPEGVLENDVTPIREFNPKAALGIGAAGAVGEL